MRHLRNLELPLHDNVIKDLIASHLSAMCVINNAELVLDVTMSEANEEGCRWIKLSFIEEKEPELIIHS